MTPETMQCEYVHALTKEGCNETAVPGSRFCNTHRISGPQNERNEQNSKRFLYGCLGTLGLGILLIGICSIIVVSSSDSNGVSDLQGGGSDTPQESLEEYWDIMACSDLVFRIQASQEAGFSNDEILASLSRADGAVRRYGVILVLQHCEDLVDVYLE